MSVRRLYELQPPIIELYTAVIYERAEQAGMFLRGRPFQTCLIIVGKDREPTLDWST